MKYLSLLISLLALAGVVVLTYCGKPLFGADSYISIIAICTTLIVGLHIVDSWTIYSLEKRLQELSKVEGEVKKTKEHTNIALHLCMGLGMVSWNSKQAITECWHAFELAIKANDAVRANTCLQCLKVVIERGKLNVSELNLTTEKIESIPLYKVFKSQIPNLIKPSKNTK